MANTFFIVDEATHDSTDWSPNAWLNVSPKLIDGGAHEGKYAVNTQIFNCDPAFEAYRSILESMPTAECGDDDYETWFPPPEE